MKYVIDPVWPWNRLSDVLASMPSAVALFAVLAALVCGVLAAAWQACWFRLDRPVSRLSTAIGLIGILVALLFFGRHAYGPAHADAIALGWPWPVVTAIPLVVGILALLLALPLLAGLAVGSYLTARVGSRKRLIVIIVRLLTFLLAFVALLRPSLGWSERSETRSTVILALDASRSMTVTDEGAKVSRWEQMLAQVEIARPALERLGEAGTDIRIVRFSDKVSDWDPQSVADGPTTDIGAALRELFERREPQALPRALFLVSDGIDHGTGAFAEATRWRNAPCPVLTFVAGDARTTLKTNDIAVTSITTTPQPVIPSGGKLTVRLTVDARGYENQPVKVRLILEDKDSAKRELLVRTERLALTTGNELTLSADAPEQPGEYLLRASVEPPEADTTPANNTIETFVTVSREGVNILLVDRPRVEPGAILDALVNARMRVNPVWIRGGVGGKDPFKLDDQPYDAILLGDVTPAQLLALDRDVLIKIEKQLARGTGLMLMGGYNALGPAWRGTPLESALPIDLSDQKQDDNQTRMVPTEDGLRVARYLFRLDDGDEKAVWERLEKLQGRSVLRLREKPRGTETVLAKTSEGEPLLISDNYGSDRKAVARVLVFGGDTTARWMRDEVSRGRFERFWRQAMLWLGRQEQAEGGVWVRPDATTRRLAVGSDLSFRVGLRGKGGVELLGGTFEADVTSPDGVKTRVPLSRGATETRGIFSGTRKPGLYRVDVKGEGKEENGGLVSGTASARVIVFDEDREMRQVAADPDYLKRLATAGGGESYVLTELGEVLNRLATQPTTSEGLRLRHAPDWKGTGRSAFLVWFVLVFCTLACLEWGLRRWWGMV